MRTILYSFLLFFLPVAAVAQCKNYVKKECLPLLESYTHNGQLNSAVLLQGETAELAMTFYSGQDYRLVVKGEEHLGTIEFKVFDFEKKEIYNNASNNHANSWDFKVNSTQMFYIEVLVPKSDATHQMVKNGCVSILVGFKKS